MARRRFSADSRKWQERPGNLEYAAEARAVASEKGGAEINVTEKTANSRREIWISSFNRPGERRNVSVWWDAAWTFYEPALVAESSRVSHVWISFRSQSGFAGQFRSGLIALWR